jgi:hypothetical protein
VSRPSGLTTADLLVATRCGYGWLLASIPRRMIQIGTPQPPGAAALTVTRVLGARHLLQAMATAWARESGLPPGPVLLAGAAVDATHAASMLGLAVISGPLRRAELADAMLEVGLGAFGVVATRRLKSGLGGSVQPASWDGHRAARKIFHSAR